MKFIIQYSVRNIEYNNTYIYDVYKQNIQNMRFQKKKKIQRSNFVFKENECIDINIQ